MPQKKTTKKSPSGLKRLGSWLKPNTRLKQLVLFVIVIGAVGGGYSVYRSKAASWTVKPSEMTLHGSASLSSDCNGSKGCVSAATIPMGSDAVAKIYVNFPVTTTIQLCAVARGQISSVHPASPILWIQRDVDKAPSNYNEAVGSWHLVQDKNYRWYCGYTSAPGGSHNLYVRVSNFYDGYSNSSNLYLSGVVMLW